MRISSGLGIPNPKNTNWLSVDDGSSELSWEFFRRQPIFQFPIGVNPKYGLEISNTIAFDGQIPIFSLFFHLFAEFNLSAGAEFVVVVTGEVMTMPGLSSLPAASSIGIDSKHNTIGLF